MSNRKFTVEVRHADTGKVLGEVSVQEPENEQWNYIDIFLSATDGADEIALDNGCRVEMKIKPKGQWWKS